MTTMQNRPSPMSPLILDGCYYHNRQWQDRLPVFIVALSSLQDRAAPRPLESVVRHRCDAERLSTYPRRIEDDGEDRDKGLRLAVALR